MIDDELILGFIEESKEHVVTAENSLLQIEGSSFDKELINKAFRAIHTIKGNSGFFGFEEISALSHSIEHLFVKIRDAVISPDPQLISILLRSIDLLSRMIHDKKQGKGMDASAIISLLANAENINSFKKEDGAKTDSGKFGEHENEKKVSDKKNNESDTELSLSGKKISAAPKETFSESESNSSSVNAETIRVRVDLLDKIMVLIGELVLGRNQLLRQYGGEKDNSLLISHSLRVSELQGNVMKTRLQPVGSLFSKFKRVVRDMAMKLGKEIKLTLEGVDVELDRSILENISDPLTHLIRNSADHGIESPAERKLNGKPLTGNITLSASHDRGHVIIRIQDDGGGINLKKVKEKAVLRNIVNPEQVEKLSSHELINLIFLPGFSTKEEVSQISGRGVGMDVVKTSFEKVGGSIDIKTEEGEGTSITVQLPLTLAIIQSIIVKVEQFRFAIPQIDVLEIVRIKKYDKNEKQIESVQGVAVYRLRGRLLPVIRLADVLSIKRTFVDELAIIKDERRILIPDRREEEDNTDFVSEIERRDYSSDRRINPEIQRLMVLRYGVNFFGLLVDAVLDPEEIVVKPLPQHISSSKNFSGVTILGDGKAAMILDIGGIIAASRFKFEALEERVSDYEEEAKRKALQEQQSILVFNNSETEFFAIPLSMISRIEKIESAKIEEIGEKEFVYMMDKNIRLLRLEDFLDIKPGNRSLKEIFIIIPNVISEPFGIVATSINDALETKLAIDRESINAPGILGSFTVNGHMTLMLDLHMIFDMAIIKDSGADNLKTVTPGKGFKVLLVEDTPFFRALEEGFFRSAGFEVSVSCDGREALNLLRQNPEAFDAVISDIEMPVMNGYELVKHIKADENLHHLPVIALTALAGKENEKRGKEAGFDSFEVKINREKLIKRVSETIEAKVKKKVDEKL